MNKTIILISVISTLYFILVNLRRQVCNKIILIIFVICFVPGAFIYYFTEIGLAFLFFSATFTCLIGLLFKEILLPRITEFMALYLSLIYCFCIMFIFQTETSYRAVLLIPFVIVYLSCIIEKPNINIVKTILYAIYLFMMIVILIAQIKLYNLQLLDPAALNIYELIVLVFNLTGMLFYGLIYGINFISVLPFPLTKFESGDDLVFRVKEQSAVFNSKVSIKQADAIITVIATFSFFFFCFMNYKLRLISNDMFLNILLAGNLIFFYEFRNIRSLLS